MARSRNNYERLLGRTVALTKEKSGRAEEEESAVRGDVPEHIDEAQARIFQERLQLCNELLQMHEGAFETMSRFGAEASGLPIDRRIYLRLFNEAVDALRQLRDIQEEMNSFDALSTQDQLRREKVFRAYFRAVSEMEGAALLPLLAHEEVEDRSQSEDGNVLYDDGLSSSAVEVVNIAQLQESSESTRMLQQRRIESAAGAYNLSVPPWVLDVASQALLKFDVLKPYPKNIEFCIDEIYTDSLTARNLTRLVMPLMAALDYSLIKTARLQEVDPESAADEYSRVENIVTMLRDYWAMHSSEIAVKYEAIRQTIDATLSVIHAYDMYRKLGRETSKRAKLLRGDGNNTETMLYD